MMTMETHHHQRIQDPLYHFDTHFPERFSHLKLNPEFAPSPRRGRKGKAVRLRNNARYRTQPITFDEIKEVDEENEDDNKENNVDSARDGLLNNLAAFSRSIDVGSCFPTVKPSSEENPNTSKTTPQSSVSTEQAAKDALDAAEEIHKNRNTRRKERKKKTDPPKERKLST